MNSLLISWKQNGLYIYIKLKGHSHLITNVSPLGFYLSFSVESRDFLITNVSPLGFYLSFPVESRECLCVCDWYIRVE